MFIFQRVVIGVTVQTIEAVIGRRSRIDPDADDMIAVFWLSDRAVDLTENILRKEAIPVKSVIISALQQF